MVLQELAQDLRHGVRTMTRRPGFAALVVVTLAVGLGTNAAIFSLVNTVLLRPVSVPESDRLVLFGQGRFRGGDQPLEGLVGTVSHELFQRLATESQGVVDVAAQDAGRTSAVVSWRGPPDENESNHAMRVWVSGNYFRVLRLPAFLGRTLEPADDRPGAPPVLVISHRYWTRRHGADPAIVGARVTVNGRAHTVVGVMPPGFDGLDMQYQIHVWMPIQAMQSDFLSERAKLIDRREMRWLVPIGRLAPGVSRVEAEARANVILQSYLADDPRLSALPDQRRATRFRLDPGAEGLSGFRDSFRDPLVVLMVGAALLFLIVCLNVSHLLLAKAATRQREMSVRAAMGASRGRLARQLLAEGALLALLGAGAGLALVGVLNDSLVSLASSSSRFKLVEAGVDGRVVLFTLALAAIAAALLGLVPLRQAGRQDLQASLRAAAPGSGGGQRLGSQVLLASQVAFSLVLLVGAGLLAGSLRQLRHMERGFEQEKVLMMFVSTEFSGLEPRDTQALQDEILRQVRAVPGVVEASLNFAASPTGGGPSHDVVLPDGSTRRIGLGAVTPGYFDTYGLRLVAGRLFTRSDGPSSPLVVIVNEAMARQLWNDPRAVGRTLRRQKDGQTLEVVGVLADTRTVHGLVASAAYVPAAQTDNYVASLEVRTSVDPGLVAEPIRRIARAANPNLPVRNVRTGEVERDRALWRERILALLSTGFGLAALFLVCVGLYGVIAQWASQRTREIGVRMALGATRGGVRWLVLRQAFKLVLAGALVGLPAAVAAARLLEGTVVGLTALDPIVLAGATLLLFAVAAAAAYLPARRASRIQPMNALRSD
jgi:predicted permease